MNKDFVQLPYSECTGCRLCESACPVSAIHMEYNEEGFSYPNINKDTCINCNKCVGVCVALNKVKPSNLCHKTVYGAKNKNQNDKLMASSGGIFPALAKWIIAQGGCVYGAAFDEEGVLKHIMTDDENSLKRLYGSKYVQSDFSLVLASASDKLREGKKVLVCGTPCQIYAARRLLGNNKNLCLVDFICHGVGSPKVFSYYLERLLRGSKPTHISFRNKDISWFSYRIKICSKNRKYQRHHRDDMYMRAYLENLILRQSCFDCKYQDSVADITVADFWDINQYDTAFFDPLGVSKVFVNTYEGVEFFDAIKSNLEIIKIDNYKFNSERTINCDFEKRKLLFNDINSQNIIDKLKKHTSTPGIKVRLFRKYRYICSKIKKLCKR